MLISEGFQQPVYTLPPAYSGDRALRSLLRRTLPPTLFEKTDGELLAFQERLAGRKCFPIGRPKTIHEAALLGDIEPSVTQYDQWGRRVDVLHTSEGWRKLKGIGAEEGLVGIFVDRKEKEHARVIGFAKTYLWVPESLYVGCPLSMTDGCARVIELAGTAEMKATILPRLASRDPTKAWTAGQWMTERPGGSDVSLTETIARPVHPSATPQAGDEYLIDGFKWFSSATDGNVALALARTSEGQGSRGLSLFLIKLRDAHGGTNGIQVHRMKKKYGTKQVPTAELSLNNAIGQLIGPLGAGVSTISTVLNITRVHSSISSVAALRRGLSIATAFAQVRHVGGSTGGLLRDNEMHTSALFRSEIVHRALLHFVFECVRLLGRSEAIPERQLGEAEKWRLRLLTPVVKAFCSDWSVKELPTLMESLGGQGYMVENEFGRLIADASVEKIWEGTTNVLALDVVRVILKSKGAAISLFNEWATSILKASKPLIHGSSLDLLTAGVQMLGAASARYLRPSPPDPRLARQLLFLVGYLTSSFCLLEQTMWSSKEAANDAESDAAVVRAWVDMGELKQTVAKIDELIKVDPSSTVRDREMERRIVYGLLPSKL